MYHKIDEYIQTIRQDLSNKTMGVVYIGVFGSYNYGVADEHSDFDFKAIVIPKHQYVAPNSHSTIIKYDFGECDVITLEYFIDHVCDFDLPYLEIIFSKYHYAHPSLPLETMRGEINKMLAQNRKQLAVKISHTMERIRRKFLQNLVYVAKKAYNVVRLYYLFRTFNRDKKYEKSLAIPNDVLHIARTIKLDQLSQDDAKALILPYFDMIDSFVNTHYNENNDSILQCSAYLESVNQKMVNHFENIYFETKYAALIESKRRSSHPLQMSPCAVICDIPLINRPKLSFSSKDVALYVIQGIVVVLYITMI